MVVDTVPGGKYTRTFNTRIPVKLGEGAINNGLIAAAPFERGMTALRQFNAYMKQHKVEKVMAFATSAIRSASNGKEFVEKVKNETGIELEVIDGDREAELIYLGNRQALPLDQNVSLIMDIGGGSNEFILANDKEIFWKQSYPLGAARLLERFKHSSPISGEEIKAIKNYLKENSASLFEQVKKYSPTELIGSSGAFDSVVEMIHGELSGEPLIDSKTGYEVNMDQYHKISTLVKSATLEQRKAIRGLTSMRFDMIVISCVLIDFVLEETGLNKMRVSTFSLKEGALFDFINKSANKS
jgi:exopolyphosphatase/guanosine-5'-triphosphate,3'-diphosphate pyrophosphatase